MEKAESKWTNVWQLFCVVGQEMVGGRIDELSQYDK